LAKKVAAKKKAELAKKVAAKKKAELAKKVAANKKAEAERKAQRVAAERARKQAQREREAQRKRLAVERKKEQVAKQKEREIAAREKAAERARIAAEKEALRAEKEAARQAEREAKEKAKQEALAAAARRKPEPPPKPPIIKTDFEDGVQATKEFDLKFLMSQRALLLDLRGTLTKQATRLEDEANALIEDVEMGDVQFDEEGGEGDTMVVERERDLVLSAQARHEVVEIDEALERIKRGEYGYSIHSGLPIPRERLKAIPWTQESVQERVGGIGRR
jgi:RNA polymerase-binding transcription factor DksA